MRADGAGAKTVIYSITVSLDGYVADPDGDISWGAPTPDLFAFHLEQVSELSAYLLGRRLYETMLVWEHDPSLRASADGAAFAEVWSALPKVVFSTTLERVEGNGRLARGSIADELERAPDGIVSVGGAALAAACVEQDLVDEYRMFVVPELLGGGTPYFPARAGRLELELLETRTFPRAVFLRHGRARAAD